MRAFFVLAAFLVATANAVPLDNLDLNKLSKEELADFFGIDLVKEAETSGKLAAWRPGSGQNPEELGHYYEVN